jgi:hypothetical protein
MQDKSSRAFRRAKAALAVVSALINLKARPLSTRFSAIVARVFANKRRVSNRWVVWLRAVLKETPHSFWFFSVFKKKAMKQGLLLQETDDDDEYESRCFGLFRVRKRPSSRPEEESAADIIDKLHALMRAKRARAAAYEGEEREQRLEAIYFATCSPPNTEMARVHARMSLAAKKMQVQEMQKYEQLSALSHKIQEARRNKHDAENLLQSAKTLRELLDGTPDVELVVDAFREQSHLVQEQSAILTDSSVAVVDDAEIDALFARAAAVVPVVNSSRTTSKHSERQPCLDGAH